jgi:hypothetical protein
VTELLQPISAAVAAVGGLVVASLALWRWWDNLKWRQREEALKLLDDLFLSDRHDGYYALVMTTLEEGETEPCRFEDCFLPHTPQPRDVNHANVIAALQREDCPDDTDAFIKGCFDDLFYYLERIGRSMERRFVTFEDVRSPMEYYVGRMARHKQIYLEYIRRIGATRALYFLNQFRSWREAEPPTNAG